MPFKASDGDTGEVFLSIDPTIDWEGLRAQVRGGRHLRMTCCDAPAVLKKSKLGLRFFAHKKGGECATAPESIEHLRLKEIAVRVIREAGWDVDVEVSGSTPSGEVWRMSWHGKVRRRSRSRFSGILSWITNYGEPQSALVKVKAPSSDRLIQTGRKFVYSSMIA